MARPNLKMTSETMDSIEEVAQIASEKNSIWQEKATEKTLIKLNSKKAQLIAHDKVVKWLKSWGIKKK